MSFSYNSVVKFHIKMKNGSHNMTVLYPNLCYNKVCYKGTALLNYCAMESKDALISVLLLLAGHDLN